MAIIKLSKQTTAPTLLTITSIALDVPSNNPRYGPQHKLIGHTPTDPDACIFLAPESAVRQLARVGLTLDTAVGHTIAITRPGDYIDFSATVGAERPLAPVAPPTSPTPAAPARPAAQPTEAITAGPRVVGIDPNAAPAPDADARLQRMFALYDKCFDHAAKTSKRLAKAEIPATHEGIAAQTATLFIEASHKGCA